MSTHNLPTIERSLERALIGLWLAKSGFDDLSDARNGVVCSCPDQGSRHRDCEACRREHLIDSGLGHSWIIGMLEAALWGEAKDIPPVLRRLRKALEQYHYEVSSTELATTLLRLNDDETEEEADTPAIRSAEPCPAA
jgi:hypothetical protein